MAVGRLPGTPCLSRQAALLHLDKGEPVATLAERFGIKPCSIHDYIVRVRAERAGRP